MSRKCQISQKKGLVGNNVSHSKRRTKRIQQPNLQWKRFWNDETKRWVRLRVSTRVLKQIGSNGLSSVIRSFKSKLSK
jgi:large subunit ribosomal protein L28